MSLRRLPEIDLANFGPLGEDDKRRALTQFAAPKGKLWSYGPSRAQVPNTFQTRNPLGLDVEKTNWEQIKNSIIRSCRSEIQEISNLQVAKILFDWLSKQDVRATSFHFPSLTLGQVDKVRYFENLASSINGRKLVPFFDHRRRGLNNSGLKFSLSVMNEQIRMQNPDFEDYSLAIFRFPMVGEKKRSIDIIYDDEFDLYDFYEINEMVSSTYRIWGEVLAARKRGEKRATGTDDNYGFDF